MPRRVFPPNRITCVRGCALPGAGFSSPSGAPARCGGAAVDVSESHGCGCVVAVVVWQQLLAVMVAAAAHAALVQLLFVSAAVIVAAVVVDVAAVVGVAVSAVTTSLSCYAFPWGFLLRCCVFNSSSFVPFNPQLFFLGR